MRQTHQKYAPLAKEFQSSFYPSIVQEVQKTVQENDVVVVGMFLNPYVIAVRWALSRANIEYSYLGYGGYLSKWKHRLAIKMWSGWPTFPQVFVKGQLMGGNSCTRKALANGSLQALLEAKTQC